MAIVSDGKGGVGEVAEAPIEAANQAYEKTSPGFGGFLTAFNRSENPVASTLMPRAEQTQYREHDWFREFLNSATIAATDSTDNLIGYQPSPKLTPEEANKQFPNPQPGGKPLFSEPIEQKLAENIAKNRGQQVQAESDVNRFEQNNSLPVRFGASVVASLMDPINAAVAFVPGLGETAIAAKGLSLAGRTAFRAFEWAGISAFAEAPVAGMKAGFADSLHSDYGIREAMGDMLMATGTGAILGPAFGGLHDLLGHFRGNKTAAVNAAPVVTANAETNHAAASTAVSQLATGKPVDVEGFFPKPPTDTAVARFMDHPFLQKVEAADLGLDRREVAKTIEPKIMGEYEAAETRKSALSAQLEEMNQARQRGETNAGQLVQDQIDQLETQLAGKLSKARRSAAESKLADLKEQSAGVPSNDDLLAIQQKVEAADNELRDKVAAIAPVLQRADQTIAQATAAESGARLDDLLARQNTFMRPDYQSMIEREKGWRKTGIAPGISHDDLVKAQGDVEIAAKAAEPAPVPKAKPEGWGAPEKPKEAATATKGESGATPAAKPEQAAPTAPERFDSATIKRDHTGEGGTLDLTGAADEIASRVHDALADGDTVILHAEGKEHPITSVDAKNVMRDGEGNPWGITIIATDASKRNHIEITPREANPYPGIDMTKLSAEEKAELMTAHKDVEAANLREGAYDEAAKCLKGG